MYVVVNTNTWPEPLAPILHIKTRTYPTNNIH